MQFLHLIKSSHHENTPLLAESSKDITVKFILLEQPSYRGLVLKIVVMK
ncbi:hypothetical protein [Oceanobacillus damuensis]|nr:hypothetical protein [Oceanobacillus damuensis]